MAITPAQRLKLIELYIGYFNRAPEQAGLDYWTAQLDSALARGVSEQAALADIANQFYQAGLQFGLFRASDSAEALIRTVYRNVLGRDEVDPEGLAYWRQRLDSGQVSRGEFVLALIQGAKDYVAAAPANDPYKWVGDYLAQRAAVGDYFAAVSAGLSGADAIARGQQIIASAATPAQARAGQTVPEALAGAIRIVQPELLQASNTVPGYEPILPRSAAPVTWLDAQQAGQAFEWTAQRLTVSFPDSIPSDHAADPELAAGWAAVPSSWRASWFNALQQALAPIDIQLQQTSGAAGDIRVVLGELPLPVLGHAYFPGSGIGGDIQLDSLFARSHMTPPVAPTSPIWNVLVHEFGHAMGLKHPFEDPPLMPAALDSQRLTIMSYTPGPDLWPVFDWTYTPATGRTAWQFRPEIVARADFGLVDLAALAAMYGLNPNLHRGDTVHQLPAPSPQTWAYRTLSDASGRDTLDLSALTRPSRIDLRPGSLSDVDIRTPADWAQQLVAEARAYYQAQGRWDASLQAWVESAIASTLARSDIQPRLWDGRGALAIADGTVIENLILGPADDTVRDNAVDNHIRTGAGHDVIHLLGGGLDIVDGGAGIDTVVLGVAMADVTLTRLPATGSAIVRHGSHTAILHDVEYLVDRAGAWVALDAALAGIPPRVGVWSGLALDDLWG